MGSKPSTRTLQLVTIFWMKRLILFLSILFRQSISSEKRKYVIIIIFVNLKQSDNVKKKHKSTVDQISFCWMHLENHNMYVVGIAGGRTIPPIIYM